MKGDGKGGQMIDRNTTHRKFFLTSLELPTGNGAVSSGEYP
jgi:hypothetical protein